MPSTPEMSPEVAREVRLILKRVAAKLDHTAGCHSYGYAFKKAAKMLREEMPD